MPTGKQCINLYTAFQNLTDKASFEQDVGVLLKIASINGAKSMEIKVLIN